MKQKVAELKIISVNSEFIFAENMFFLFSEMFSIPSRTRATTSSTVCYLCSSKVQQQNTLRVHQIAWAKAGLPNLFSVKGHFHMKKFIAGHKRVCDVTISYCDVTDPLILISFMR